MNKILLSVDPGASGAVAIRFPSGVETYNFKTEEEMTQTIKDLKSKAKSQGFTLRALIEKVGGYVGKDQPGSAMFKFGRNFGFYFGVFHALGIEVSQVIPQVWQKSIEEVKGTKGPDHKRALRDYAQKLFPNLKVTLKNADALLILLWGEENDCNR